MLCRKFIYLILLFTIHVYSNHLDTTLFTSDFEKETFKNYLKSGNIDPIDLFIGFEFENGNLLSKDIIKSYISELKNKGIPDYKTKKKLKYIYKDVHSRFLKKYNDLAFFKDIFNNGDYNCVTASALYCFVLQALDIKYSIKQTPTHVYIIADPENTMYLIETTLPVKGIIQFDDKYKKAYIEYLHNTKIISDSEFTTQSTDALFQKHYLVDESISLTELAGIQYYNKGIQLFNDKKFTEASPYFEKANILFQSNMVQFMFSNNLANILDTETGNKQFKGASLAKFINCNAGNDQITGIIDNYFQNVTNELIINHPDIRAYQQYYNEFKTIINDTIKCNNIDQNYYIFSALYYYSNYAYPKSLSFLQKAYSLNNDNIQIKEMVKEVMGKHLLQDDDYEASIDSIEYYYDQFQFLMKEKALQRFLLYCYSQSIAHYLKQNIYDEGNALINRFEKLIDQIEGVEISDEVMNLIYGNLAMYHQRMSRDDLAKEALKRGLEISPDNKALARYLEGINNPRARYSYQKYDQKYTDKYNLYLSLTRANRNVIGANVDKYICRKWKMSKIIKNDKEVDVPSSKRMTLTFIESGKLIFDEGPSQYEGTWIFDRSNCMITYRNKRDKAENFLIIREISANTLRALMLSENNVGEAVEVILSSY
ncbi:MAG: hypothetical protein JXB49_00440 [Bacteroidales bacterium]|nr:hypothetical protein [Bacteroidales bacterium]